MSLLDELGSEVASLQGPALFGDSLLHLAVRLRDRNLVVKLLDLGLSWRLANDFGQTPLDLVNPFQTLEGAEGPPLGALRRLFGPASAAYCPDEYLSASSYDDPDHLEDVPSMQIWKARLDTPGKCWMPRDHDMYQWLQFSFPEPMRVVAVQTMGRSDCDERVVSYRLQYKQNNDASEWTWFPPHDKEALAGNTVPMRLMENRVPPIPSCTRLRIRPVGWEGHIAMRADLLGMPTSEFDTLEDEDAHVVLISSCSLLDFEDGCED